VSWTNEQRCGGTPEALATQHELPALRTPASAPDRGGNGALVVVVILPAREPTETATPERVLINPPASTDEAPPEWPEVPVQLPEETGAVDRQPAR
jgi:hypothetical protein